MDEQTAKRLVELENRLAVIEETLHLVLSGSDDEEMDIIERQHQEFRARNRASRMREALNG